MSGIVVIGSQWGDEGKGKIVDYLTSSADMVVRFQGGNNAGHTLVVDGKTTKLSLIPSGVLHEGAHCLIGAGTVIDPEVLLKEIADLRTAGVKISPERLMVDARAHLILPYHIAIDKARELKKGENKIGTTGRGIGPTYEDRAARCGIQVSELKDLQKLSSKLDIILEEKNKYLRFVLESDVEVTKKEVLDLLHRVADSVIPFIGNVGSAVASGLYHGKKIVFEGAQGTLLDQSFGTLPYVTSSHTISGAVSSGVGIGPKLTGHVLGIAKAYSTRVGSGPFPSEMHGELADSLRKAGGEFGTITGRARRIGWFDAVAMRHSVLLNGIDSIALTKLDVLTGLDKIMVCVAYERDGRTLEDEEVFMSDLEGLTPKYVEFDGWKEELKGSRKIHHLPEAAQVYVHSLSEMVGVPFGMISVGPEREETIFSRQVPFILHYCGVDE